MFTLNNLPNDRFEFNGLTGTLNLNFNVVLSVFEVLQSKEYSDLEKLNIAIMALTGEKLDWPYEQKQALFIYLMNNHVNKSKPVIDPDAARKTDEGETEPEQYNLISDADFIYASFWMDYGIDLHKQFNKLHWYEFRALLSGLSKHTKFREVLEIRNWKPPKKNAKNEEARIMRRLQQIYAVNVTQEDVDWFNMDLKEREQYILDHPEVLE